MTLEVVYRRENSATIDSKAGRHVIATFQIMEPRHRIVDVYLCHIILLFGIKHPQDL